jgi:hypothetical protein
MKAILLACLLTLGVQSPGPPVAVVVMMDLASSSWWHVNDPEFEGAFDGGFRKKLSAGDLVIVGSSSASIRLPDAWDSDPQSLQKSLRAAIATPDKDRYGNSLIWDGLDRAVSLLKRAPSTSRRGIILITDGRAAGNRIRPEEIVARAREANVAIHVIQRGMVSRVLPQASGGVYLDRPEVPLSLIAQGTGGGMTRGRADASLEIQKVLLAGIEAIRR